jgi:hypothetical protein
LERTPLIPLGAAKEIVMITAIVLVNSSVTSETLEILFRDVVEVHIAITIIVYAQEM